MKTKTTFVKRLVVVTCALVAVQSALAFYSPSTGRWLSRDPIAEGGGANLYGFVANDSVKRIDDLGLAFYAIDGTWAYASLGANPWMLYMDTSETPKYYYRGPHLGGTGLDSWGIVTTVKKQICEDFCQAKQEGTNLKINLTGWSRGAIIAAGVARLLNDKGCDCSCKTYRPISVNWVGLFDAVAQMPFDHWWPRRVTDNVKHFDHAIKTSTRQKLFPTWHFVGGTERAFNNYDGTPTTHSDIGMSEVFQNNDSYFWIKHQAIAAGVTFAF